MVHVVKVSNSLIEKIFVGNSPGGYKIRIFVTGDIDDFRVAVSQKEGSHVVKMRLSAVNE